MFNIGKDLFWFWLKHGEINRRARMKSAMNVDGAKVVCLSHKGSGVRINK